MVVPTVERGFLLVLFCWMAMAGERPSIESTSGLSIMSRNCLAYAERDSTYLLCPSAYMVSKARVDLPEPERPLITSSEFLGRSTFMFLRLWCLAPRMESISLTIPL